jgi:hypothetical protein
MATKKTSSTTTKALQVHGDYREQKQIDKQKAREAADYARLAKKEGVKK